ncbi:MAG: hypothetical protein IJ558_02535 [Treponema sp.]|nr:hypothetical protein [Treponema sp.]
MTRTELLILNNISRTLYFIEKKAKNYPVTLFNLENWYGRANEDEKVIPLCEKGIDVCIRYGKLTTFPYQVFNKGYSLVKLGKIEDGKKCLSQAFIIIEAMKEFDNLNYGKNR